MESHLPLWTWNSSLYLGSSEGLKLFQGPALILFETVWEGLGIPSGHPVPQLPQHSFPLTVFIRLKGSPSPRGGWAHILRLPKMGRFTCSGEARNALSLGRALRRAT